MSKSYWLKDQKGNFSNKQMDTFDPAKRYTGIRLQQGVPLLDRDWNELEDIRRYEEQMLRKWYIGNGTPDDGFRISATDPVSNDFKISAGRCLVDGFEAVNEPYPDNFILYSNQKVDNKIPELKPPKGNNRKDTVYLDVWIEEIGKDKDERLKNSDDVNVETCVRHKIMWLVRVHEGSNGDYKKELATAPAQGTNVKVDEGSNGDYEKEKYHHYYDIAEITRNPNKGIESKDIQDLRGKRSFHNLNVLPNGNVGIGTADPLIHLAIGDNNTGLNQQSDDELAIYTNNQERVRIDNNGNVGIGTPTPGEQLEVVGNIKLSGDNVQIQTPFFKAGQGNSAEVKTGKWYRIAENKAKGKRANAEFTLRDYISSGGHSSLTFRIGISYNDAPGMSFTVLNHSRYLLTTFIKIRVLEKDTYAAQYLEVFVNRSGKVEYSIYDNLQDGGWDPVDWEEITTVPNGYESREFDVDKLFIVGDNENRFTVDRGGNVCINVSSKELMDSDSIANLSVDEALNTINDLKSKKFKYITDKDKMYIGFIAEEVPDLLKTDKTSLSIMNIISVLTSVVQNQQEKINQLQQFKLRRESKDQLQKLQKLQSELKVYDTKNGAQNLKTIEFKQILQKLQDSLKRLEKSQDILQSELQGPLQQLQLLKLVKALQDPLQQLKQQKDELVVLLNTILIDLQTSILLEGDKIELEALIGELKRLLVELQKLQDELQYQLKQLQDLMKNYSNMGFQ